MNNNVKSKVQVASSRLVINISNSTITSGSSMSTRTDDNNCN